MMLKVLYQHPSVTAPSQLFLPFRRGVDRYAKSFVTLGMWSLVWTVAAVASAAAQPAQWVAIETNAPDALVYIDDAYAGTAAQRVFVADSAAVVRLVAPDVDTWSVEPLERTLTGATADTVHLAMVFPYYYRVETLPFGADVYVEGAEGRRRLGDTPLTYRSEKPLAGTLVIERLGYQAERVEPGRAIWNRTVLSLQPAQHVSSGAAEIPWVPAAPRRRWIDVAAASLAVGGGILAVHYKFKADRRYDDYVESGGDEAFRDDIQQFDTRAAISLGAMQVGVGVLAIRLALR